MNLYLERALGYGRKVVGLLTAAMVTLFFFVFLYWVFQTANAEDRWQESLELDASLINDIDANEEQPDEDNWEEEEYSGYDENYQVDIQNQYDSPPEPSRPVTSGSSAEEADASYESLEYQGVQLKRERTKTAASSPERSNAPQTYSSIQTEMDVSPLELGRAKPDWGTQVSYGVSAFDQSGFSLNAVSLQLEYQPSVLHDWGILGVGPAIGIYPHRGNNYLHSSLASTWSLGGQVRYQGRYFRSQILVPSVSYSWDRFVYRNSGGSHESFWVKGPTLGLWFLLNSLDAQSSSIFYHEIGVSRSYLVGEVRFVRGSDADLSLSGNSYYLGLRTEF